MRKIMPDERKYLGKDRISALPEDLLIKILLILPTKKAVSTTILSKRWRSIWKMLPTLVYKDTDYESDKSVWWLLDQSLQLNKAPVLQRLEIELGPTCPVHVDVGKSIENAVDRCIRSLDFNLLWSAEPTSLSKTLYSCKILKELTLSNKILVDVPLQASLPSLQSLKIVSVVYKGEDSVVRLLSSCPVLQRLYVKRNEDDNVTNFNVKVPSLQLLMYLNDNSDVGEIGGSLVIDCPRLNVFNINDTSENKCLIENMTPHLALAVVAVVSQPNEKFLRCLSSVMCLDLMWTDATDAFCSDINFSRLIMCKLSPYYSEHWVDSILLLLRNSPKLKALRINSDYINDETEDMPLRWNQPSSVPLCFSSRLNVFEWDEYGGTREEKQLLTYILANSKCLKEVRISASRIYSDEEKGKMMKELESMSRVSASSQLVFSTQLRPRYRE